MHRYLIPSVAAVALLIVAAVVQGHFTERWGKRPVTEVQKAFAERLAKAPTAVGDWTSVEIPIDERQLEASRSVGSFSRAFQNKYDPSKVIQLFMVCGHPRDVTLHTPDQCYVLNGFSEVGEEQKFAVDSKDGSTAWFWTNRFRKAAAYEGPAHLRIFWSFSENGEWLSPTIARMELANVPALYKIYAITEVSGDRKERPEESAAVGFLKEYMPALNAVLFPPEPGQGEGGTKTAASAGASDQPTPGEK